MLGGWGGFEVNLNAQLIPKKGNCPIKQNSKNSLCQLIDRCCSYNCRPMILALLVFFFSKKNENHLIYPTHKNEHNFAGAPAKL